MEKFGLTLIFLSLFLVACSSEKRIELSHKEKVESDSLYYGKKFGSQISELPNSILVRGILRDYLKNIDNISFYKNLTFNDFLFDANLFLLDQNVPLSPVFCDSEVKCPRIYCKNKDKEFSMRVSGECFNDTFVFLGNVDYIYRIDDISNLFSFFYKVNLDSWHFKNIETKEYILYEGNITFNALSSEKEKIIKRDIAIFGDSEIIYESNRNKIGIQFESVFDYYYSYTTDFVSLYYAQIQNPLCIAFVFNTKARFTCSYKFFVKKYNLKFSAEEIHVVQSDFETFNVGGNLLWILTESDMKIFGENLYQNSLSQANCKVLNGQIKFSSGSEELTLTFENKNFGNQKCNFLCASQWYWKDTENSKDYLGYGCLPGAE